MRAILGVDASGTGRAALETLAKLRFPDLEVHLVHAVEPIAMPVLPLPSAFVWPTTDVLDGMAKAGRRALEEAERTAASLGLSATSHLANGSAAHVLAEEADRLDADLVVVQAAHEGPAAALLGSVSRALLTQSHRSVLVCKRPIAGDRVRTVIATDHSDYMDRCLDRLVALAPAGLENLVVLTANPAHEYATAELAGELPPLQPEVGDAIREHLKSRGAAAAAKLAALGLDAQVRVEADKPNEAIRRTMAETRSDLLVVGAQGHNFLDRFLLGSVSYRQAAYEPYSVLVLRLPHG